MDTVRFHGPILHVQVPNLDVQIVPGAQVATRVTELHVRYTTDNLGEEVLGRRVLPLLKYFKHSFLLSKKSQRLVTAQTTWDKSESAFKVTFGLGVTQGGLSHVAQTNDSFAAAVHKQIALDRMELGCCDDLC